MWICLQHIPTSLLNPILWISGAQAHASHVSTTCPKLWRLKFRESPGSPDTAIANVAQHRTSKVQGIEGVGFHRTTPGRADPHMPGHPYIDLLEGKCCPSPKPIPGPQDGDWTFHPSVYQIDLTHLASYPFLSVSLPFPFLLFPIYLTLIWCTIRDNIVIHNY